ncbi:MAG: hypothetical protein DRP75_04610 [Candidatus Omnitrophota bacterium]|nr:MAG: hypothetical protein DRP75_04610 [Candidatus Omnitrophota bacterium]
MWRKGFSFLELILASTVLLIALVSLLTSNFNASQVALINEHTSVALNEAQAVLEEMRRRNLRASIVSEDWAGWLNAHGCFCLPAQNLTVTYPSGTDADPLEIRVRVDWNEQGRVHTVQLLTLLTER